MPHVRAVAIRLAKEGLIDITRRGQVVTVEKEKDIRGPIRLRASSNRNVYTQSTTYSKSSPAAEPGAVSS
jgi:DNA-binding GntR family transcriptional regulator